MPVAGNKIGDIKELFCNAPNVIHLRDATNTITGAASTSLAYTAKVYASSGGLPTGAALITQASVNQTNGYYTITISKANSELLTKGTEYILDIDEDSHNDGGTALVTAVWA